MYSKTLDTPFPVGTAETRKYLDETWRRTRRLEESCDPKEADKSAVSSGANHEEADTRIGSYPRVERVFDDFWHDTFKPRWPQGSSCSSSPTSFEVAERKFLEGGGRESTISAVSTSEQALRSAPSHDVECIVAPPLEISASDLAWAQTWPRVSGPIQQKCVDSASDFVSLPSVKAQSREPVDQRSLAQAAVEKWMLQERMNKKLKPSTTPSLT